MATPNAAENSIDRVMQAELEIELRQAEDEFARGDSMSPVEASDYEEPSMPRGGTLRADARRRLPSQLGEQIDGRIQGRVDRIQGKCCKPPKASRGTVLACT